MKILIASTACKEYEDRRLACAETWGSTTLCDIKFFTSDDLNIPDEANQLASDKDGVVAKPGQSLTYRTQAICRWALERGYDFVFKCDDDTYIFVERLLASGFENHDYSGWSWQNDGYTFASGGAGYWLSRKAMKIISEATDLSEPREDMWVGALLHKAEIVLHGDSRYNPWPPPTIKPDCITIHRLLPAEMRSLHGQ